MRYELVEVDMEAPEDEAEMLVSQGSFLKVMGDLEDALEEALEDYDERGYEWPTYRVQPAS